MDFKRYYFNVIKKKLVANKVVLLIGARRVGKTYLIRKIIADFTGEKVIFLSGDDLETHRLLQNRTIENYKRLMGNSKFLVIDEAQEIMDIGKKLKLIVDNLEGIKILVTGSSAFELNKQLGEPLVGRMFVFELYPIAQMELSEKENYNTTISKLEERLVYGTYPELLNLQNLSDKKEYLSGIVSSYLLKDILAYEGIRKREVIMRLLQKIAFRIGSEISLSALGNELHISKNTVEKYLDLFQKCFIIYSVSGFNRNRDNEITKMKKWYFNDNGIRNAMINNFNPFNLRDDNGVLWENYLNAERNKYLTYNRIIVQNYFWRTHNQQEIDRIEDGEGKIKAFEYKLNKKQSKVPSEFASAYQKAIFQTINKGNYLDFITSLNSN